MMLSSLSKYLVSIGSESKDNNSKATVPKVKPKEKPGSILSPDLKERRAKIQAKFDAYQKGMEQSNK